MAKHYHDFRWSSEGDFLLDPDTGDFLSTKDEAYRGLIQKILTRLESNQGDWLRQPLLGADIEKFRGRGNTAETADEIKARIRNELVGSGILSEGELVVEAVPAGESRIVSLLFITPIGSTKTIVLNFDYDLRNNKVAKR